MVSMEIREIVSEDRKKGMSVREIGMALNLPLRTVNGLLEHERETGSMAPKPHKGRRPALDEKGLERLKQIILKEPDMTLEEMEKRMGISIDISAMSRIVRFKLGFNLKKKRFTR
jgi:transposase